MRQTPEAAFEQIATPTELAAILRVIEAGRPARLNPDDLAVGRGSGWVMAAFLHGRAARFNDDTFGAFYAASSQATAVAETQFHYARFLRDAHESHTLIGVRLLHAVIAANPLDIRGRMSSRRDLYNPDPAHYAAGQKWAAEQRTNGADGVVYTSLRHPDGECIALFRPRLVTACRLAARLAYEWDGTHFANIFTLAAGP